MGVFSRIKRLRSTGRSLLPVRRGQPQISVIRRTDGVSATGLPAHINQDIAEAPTTLMCSDGTRLPMTVSNTLLTGTSRSREEIVYRHLVSAVKSGFTPLVISSQGERSEIYHALRTVYHENDINIISASSTGDYYLPFLGMSPENIADFFYRLVVTLDPRAMTDSMLYKRYIDVCVRLFCTSSEPVQRLIEGRIDHLALLNEIAELRANDRISPQQETMLRDMADSAQSVSVSVLSVFYDFMYRMRYASAPKHGRFPFNTNKIPGSRPIFVDVEPVSGIQPGAPFAQNFQWYISQVLEAEFTANPSLEDHRILVIVDNLGGTELRWFSWLFELRNSVMLLHYDDYFSLLSSSEDLRESFAARMDRVYFFAHINSASAEWCSRFIGMRSTVRRSTTTRAAQSWSDLWFPARDVHEEEVDEAWYRREDIQRLGDAGIVYSSEGAIFRNGNSFSTFEFRYD